MKQTFLDRDGFVCLFVCFNFPPQHFLFFFCCPLSSIFPSSCLFSCCHAADELNLLTLPSHVLSFPLSLSVSLSLCVSLAPHFHMKVQTGPRWSPEYTDRPCAAPIQLSFPLQLRTLSESIMFSLWCRPMAFDQSALVTNSHSQKIN